MIQDIIDEVYQEAISFKYPKTKERTRVIESTIDLLEGIDVYDLCPQGMELVELTGAEPLIPTTDMHQFLDELEPLDADMIVVRHVLEHSIMPYVLLKLLKKHTKKVLLIVPENTKRIIDYDNHYSVFNRDGWENLFNKSGWKYEFIGEFDFQKKEDTKEWRYLLK